MRSSVRAPAAAAALTVTGLALQGAAAQTPEPDGAAPGADAARSVIEAHRVTVSGEQRPDDIPFIARMQAFFRRFHTNTDGIARELALTTEDRGILSTFAEEALADYARLARQQLETICSRAGELDVEATGTARWASELEALAQGREDEWTQRYTAVLDSVSPRARESIERYVHTRIVPHMTWSSVDLAGLAQEAPDAAATMLQGRCEADQRPPRVIKSASYSATADPMAGRGFAGSADVVAATDADDLAEPSDDALVRAAIRFERIMAADELIGLLSGTGLELESLHHRNVGRGQGTIRFSSGVDVADAVRAAEERVVVTKLARAYASQRGVRTVLAPIGPPGVRQPVLREPGRPSRSDRQSAPRPTREELDAIALPPCPARDELAEPVPDTEPLTEAACGFRPYAVVVRGEAADIEALRESAGTELAIELEPDP